MLESQSALTVELRRRHQNDGLFCDPNYSVRRFLLNN